MHNDGTDAHIFHQGDILHDLFLQIIAHHGIAAVFDDNGLAGKFLDIGQGFHQNARLHLCRYICHTLTPQV